MPTFRTDILAIGVGIHCHEVVESNAIRAADDHGLSPQAGVSILRARNPTPRIAKVM